VSTHTFRFTLFVTGMTPRTELALANLRRICDDRLIGCELDVIDVLEQPELAEQWKILATPTLIREAPPPRRRVTGDLSDTARVLQFLMLPDTSLHKVGDSGA
jgi:circadian clock protein KaiB